MTLMKGVGETTEKEPKEEKDELIGMSDVKRRVIISNKVVYTSCLTSRQTT